MIIAHRNYKRKKTKECYIINDTSAGLKIFKIINERNTNKTNVHRKIKKLDSNQRKITYPFTSYVIKFKTYHVLERS